MGPVPYSAPESMMSPVHDNLIALTTPRVTHSIPETTVDSPESEYAANVTQFHDIDELAWLNVSNSTQPTVTLNATNVTYQVLLNTVSGTPIPGLWPKYHACRCTMMIVRSFSDRSIVSKLYYF